MATNTITRVDMTVEEESRNWWWLGLLKGIALILFGIAVIAWPVGTTAAVLWMIGFFAIVYGIIGIIQGFVYMARSFGAGLLTVLVGLLGIVLGSLIFKYPGGSFYSFMFLAGLWFIISGGINLFRPTRDPSMRGFSVAGGILSILVGIMLLNRPITNGLILFWILGIYGLIAGPIAIYGAFQARGGRTKHHIPEETTHNEIHQDQNQPRPTPRQTTRRGQEGLQY